MAIDDELEAMMRRAVRDGIQECRSVLRDEVIAALAASGGASEEPTGPDQEVDTVKAATLAHVQPRTINDWKRRGWLTPIKRGKRHFFRAGDVLAVARDRGAPRKILNLEDAARRILEDRKR